MRVVALQADLLNAAFGQRGQDLFILPPLVTERFLPVVIGLDAVAIANVYSRCAGQPARGNFKRLDAPVGGFFHVNVKGRFVKLDDVHTIGLQGQCFLIQ